MGKENVHSVDTHVTTQTQFKPVNIWAIKVVEYNTWESVPRFDYSKQKEYL